jgi:hypothetical protein
VLLYEMFPCKAKADMGHHSSQAYESATTVAFPPPLIAVMHIIELGAGRRRQAITAPKYILIIREG